jgi:tripartite-type tricarboxylate transporter receptor subunit TctC
MGIRSIAAALLLTLASSSLAQEWPVRPVRFIVPSGPGGLMESVFAVIREALEKRLGQRVIIENRAGGGGNIGAQAVAAAGADGHTFLLTASTVMVTNPHLLSNTTFDPLRELAPISQLIDFPLVLWVGHRHPVQTLREFIEHARANPGKVNFASPGPSTPPHLAGEILLRAAKLDLVHVPYKGAAAAGTALIANEVQLMIIAYASLRGQMLGGLARPLAVAATERLGALPAVPTIAEAGYPEIAAEMPRSWWGLAGPRSTPEAIVKKLHADFREVLLEPPARKRIEDLGINIVANTPEEFGRALGPESRRWEGLVRALNLKAE